MSVLVGEVAEEDFATEAHTAGSRMCGAIIGTILERGGAVTITQTDQEEVGDGQLTTHPDGVTSTVLFRNLQILFRVVITITEIVGRIKRGHPVIGELILRTDESTLGNNKTEASNSTERCAQFVLGKIVVRMIV